jgi:hypothetical protein
MSSLGVDVGVDVGIDVHVHVDVGVSAIRELSGCRCR